jgi:serine beta-lactamase-like protein LACTB
MSTLRWICIVLLPFLLFVLQSDVPARKPYQEAAKRLDHFITAEIADKGIPALSIALVDNQTTVWSKGFGFADPQAKSPATADTVYRVGSVSKPFTALLLMLFVELGLIDLDTPATKYLPDFRPKNPFGKAITLRQMLAHRSGLVRETPVGSYFDASQPTLARMVASLNQTELVYAPETKTSYSNAAVSTVGYLLEKTQKEDFAKLIRRKLLHPLGMTSSAFELTPEMSRRLAKATMWTYHGRTFPAPTFELGTPPAGSLYSTVNDLARFLSFLFAGGNGPNGRILKKETLEQMWKIQYCKPGDQSGFGISFLVSEFEGRRRVGHGGAIYGFATELAALPDDKLGVVVTASKDVSNAVTRRIADEALRQLLAVKAGQPPPPIVRSYILAPMKARELAGRYQNTKGEGFDLKESAGKLWLLPSKGGSKMELRQSGHDILVVDDLLGYGEKLQPVANGLRKGDELFKRVPVKTPAPLPEKWKGLIGEYGEEYSILTILERDGKLNALIEWVFLYPLEEIGKDIYRFPDFGLYHGDKVVFHCDNSGRAIKAVAANVEFKRRKIDGENGETFTIKPVRPLNELRREALAAAPPIEKGKARKPNLVDLTTLDPTIKLDLRYATRNNFLQTPFYTSAKAYLQRPAAEALVRAHKKLEKVGYGLLIHDAYRPWHVTKMFWDATPAKYHHFVADPSQGSRHNRGCAVDLTLYDRKTGKVIDMVGGFDEFSDRSYPDYLGGTSLQRWHRDLLRRSMESEGFTVYEAEWWHYDYNFWRDYPILNLTFEQVEAGK